MTPSTTHSRDDVSDDDVLVQIVDDEAEAAESLAALLRLDGYRVVVATDGRAALAQAQREPPHCMLLDLEMPGMDGWAVADALRDRLGSALVLIAVTGWGDAMAGVSPRLAHFDHCLRKPVDPQQLQRLLPPIPRTPDLSSTPQRPDTRQDP